MIAAKTLSIKPNILKKSSCVLYREIGVNPCSGGRVLYGLQPLVTRGSLVAMENGVDISP